MRLWHQSLIRHLDRKRLLGQHRECCALRGHSWGKKHSVVNYVFAHPFSWLFCYHTLVMNEMERRGYKVDTAWKIHTYRGKDLVYSYAGTDFAEHDFPYALSRFVAAQKTVSPIIYPEHTDAYLKACLENLEQKGANLIGTSPQEELIKLALKGQ